LQSQHPNKGLEDLCDELKRRLLRSPRLSLLGIYGSGSWISEVIWMLRSPTCHHRTVSEDSSMSTRRSRAAIACEKCRQRKVRCSITLTGVPCISCTQDGSVCAVRHTKFNRYVDQRPIEVSADQRLVFQVCLEHRQPSAQASKNNLAMKRRPHNR
jgi:hypothetical protein